MNLFLLLSRIGIRPRVFGGYALILGFLIALAAFAAIQVGRIGGTVGELVVSADGDAGMARVRTSLLVANGALEKFIRTGTAADREAATKAIDGFGRTFEQIDRQFADLPAIAAGAEVLKSALANYRSSFAALAGAVDRLRSAGNSTDALGAAAGLDIGAIQIAISNRSGPLRSFNPMRLAAIVDMARVAVMRYTATLLPGDAEDAKLTLINAQTTVTEAEDEIDAASEPKLKTLVMALKAKLASDGAALADVVKAANELRAIQGDLSKTSAAIDNETSKINGALGAARADQGDKTAAAVQQTRYLVMATAAGALVVGAALAWLIGASVSGPIHRMTARMQSLAGGQLDEAIPDGNSRDEIGRMSRAVEVFRENAQTVRRMERESAAQREMAEAERTRMMVDLADRFDRGMAGAIGGVGNRADEIGQSAQVLARVAERGRGLAEAVAARAGQASLNVQTVAAATQELSASISEISSQVSRSVLISTRARNETEQTSQLMGGLSEAVDKIGTIVQLIQAIASQTNLLALNATIEAARAGDSGRGFAVVASEVKSLANQTAQATEQIASQIATIQNATGLSVAAIEQFGQTVAELTEIATVIAAAIEEQGAATGEIARNVEAAASGTAAVSREIGEVRAVAGETDAGAEAALAAAAALQQQAVSLKTNVDDFLTTVRDAA
jgi:methyl-accepting chemotaxis protein